MKGRRDSLRYGMVGIAPFNTIDYSKPDADYAGYGEVSSDKMLEIQAQLDAEERERDLASLSSEAPSFLTNPNSTMYSGSIIEPKKEDESDLTFLNIWRLANVLGHSVNLSKKQEELITTEGKWLPEIQVALEYLLNKKQLLELTSNNNGSPEVLLTIDSILLRNNELENSLKLSAKTNPYLTDIFYETKPGKVLSKKEFGIKDILNYYTYDIASDRNIFTDWDPSNNLKNQLTQGPLNGLFGQTHKLSDDQINTMWNLRNQYDAKSIDLQLLDLKTASESARLLFDEKNANILDKLNTIKKGNFLFDPTLIDPEFTKKFQENDISLTDPKSWAYALPHLGSSYSELATTIALMGAGAILNNVAKGALTTTTGGTLPLLYAITEAGAMLALNQYQRESETSSEAFDNYQSRVLNEVNKQNINLDQVYKELEPQLQKFGYDIDNMDDYTKFQAILATGLQSSNSTFNDIVKDSREGVEVLKQTNRALSAGDYLESMMFSYGGAYLSKMYGVNRLKNAMQGKFDDRLITSNVLRAIEQDPIRLSNVPLFEEGRKMLDRSITRVANKITNPITKIAAKDGINTITNIGKKAGISYFMERTEEGLQYLVGQRYQAGNYDNVKNYGFLDGLANAMLLGVEANAAYYGIHPDNYLNTDKELIKNMSIGGFTGLFMTGAYAAPLAYKNIRLTVTDVKLRAMAADNYAKAEKDIKIEQFLNVGRGKGNLQYVINTLLELKNNKPNEVTDEMIDDDIALAKDVYSYANTNIIKDVLDLKILGTDSDKNIKDYVKSAVQILTRYREQAKSMNESVGKLTKTIDSIIQDVTTDEYSASEPFFEAEYLKYLNLEKENPTDYSTFKQQITQLMITFNQYKAALQLQLELQSREEDLKKLAANELLDVNTNSIQGIKLYVLDKIKALRKEVKAVDNIMQQLGADEKTAIDYLDNSYNPILPNQEQLRSETIEAMLNTGAAINLRDHRDAYIFGLYEDNLLPTNELMADLRTAKTKKARLIIIDDILRRRELELVARQETDLQFNINQEPTQQEIELGNEELPNIIKDEVIVEKPKTEPEVDLIEEEETITDEILEDTPVVDEIEETYTSEELRALEAIDSRINPLPIIEEEQADTFEVTNIDLAQIDVELNLDNFNVGDELIEIELLNNAAEEIKQQQEENAVEEISRKIEDGTYIPEELVAPEDAVEEVKKPDDASKAEEIVKKDKEAQQKAPETIEEPAPIFIDKPVQVLTLDDEVLPINMVQAEPSEIFIDPSTDLLVWDPSGLGNIDNSITIDSQNLFIQESFENMQDNSIYGPGDEINSRDNIDKLEGLSDKNKQKKNRIKNTFFYQPNSIDIMPIRVAGKEITIKTIDDKVAQRAPGKELSENLSKPGWLKSADDIYYVVTSSTHLLSNPYDDLAVHMLIEKDGKVYNTSLRAITDELRSDLRYLGLTQEQVEAEIKALRSLRKKIIDAYSAEYFSSGNLPTTALKHVKPVNLRISNGTIDNVKIGVGDSTVPVYRKLNTIPSFQISLDPIELSKLITTGEVELGYGVGAFTVGTPYSISKLDESGDTSVQGTGYAGKIYYVPKATLTPSQRVSLPIMLAEELHSIKANSADEVQLAFDSKGNRIKDADGKPLPISTAELIFELLKREIFGAEIDDAILGILANHGGKTVTIGLSETEKQNLNFLVRKLLHVFENKKGRRILITAGRKRENDKSRGYNTRYTDLSNITDSQKRLVVLDISRNIHWNTDKKMMSQPIPQAIVDAVVADAKLHPEFDENYMHPFLSPELSFSLKDVGYTIENGLVIKIAEETPILASWMINHGILKTDVSQKVFRDPFVYADDISVSETKVVDSKPTAKPIVKKEVLSSGLPVRTESLKKVVTEAILATPENLSKYNLTIPTDKGLLLGRMWAIYPDKTTGELKVGQVPKNFVKGVYSVLQGTNVLNYTEAKQWLMDTLGLDVTQVRVINGAMRMLSDAKVYGVMLVAMDRVKQLLIPSITLSNESGKGVEYHEAWHYVNLLLLNEVERLALYQEYVDNNRKAANYTKQEVEEALAEEFRSWMLKEINPSITSKIKSFFRHIKEFVMKISGRGSKYFAFNAIKNGYFKKYKPSQQAMGEFVKAYQDGVYYYIPGMTKEQQQGLPSITDSNTFYDIVDSLTSSCLAIMNIKTSEDVLKVRTDVIFDQMQEDIDNGWMQEESIQLANEVIANKDVFKQYIYDTLEELRLKDVERIETEEANRLASEAGDNPDNSWDKNQGDISKKANISFNAKLFFYSIPKTKYVFTLNESGIIVKLKVDERDPIFGLPITEQFDIVWNKIMENMWMCETTDDPNDLNSMVAITKRLANTDPFFDSLHNILTSTDNPISENTMTLLLNTIKSSKNSMTTINIKPKKEKLAFDASDELIMDQALTAPTKFVWDMLDSDNLRKIARYPRLWSNSFFTSDNVTIMPDGQRRVSTNGFKFMLTRRFKITSLMTAGSKGKFEDATLQSKLLEALDAFLEICNALQIPFDRLALDYMLNQFEDTSKPTRNSEFNKFFNFWNARGLSFNLGILSDITTMYNGNKLNISNRSGDITRSLDRIFTSGSEKAQINLMAVAYGKTHPSPEEFSVTGADGSLIYPISENNYMSDLIRWFNSNTNNKKENILSTPYGRSSLLANTNSQLKLHTLIAVDDELSGISRDYFGISPLEDYIAKLTITFNGHLILPTMSDKKTWYSISGLQLPKLILKSILTTFTGDLSSGEAVTTTQTVDRRFNDKALDIMSNYFIDELNSVISYYQNKHYVETHPEEWVTNYHGKIVDGKMKDGGNGGRFRYFNQLNIGGETLFLNRDLAKYEKYDTNEKVLEYLNNLRELTMLDSSLLRDAANNILITSTQKELDRISKKDIGIITKSKDGFYNNKLIPDNIFSYYKDLLSKITYPTLQHKDQDALYSLIGTHVLLSFISILEVEKCFTGDPAYYKWLKTTIVEEEVNYEVASARDVDKTKRLSSVLSTGTNLRTYWGEGDPRNDTSFTVMNMSDNNVYSQYYDNLKLIFRTSLIRDMMSTNDPLLTDDLLMAATDTPSNILKLYNKLSKEQLSFVDKLSEASADPYGFRQKGDNKEGNINLADAAVYIRPAMYKRIMQALGEWNDSVEEAFNILEGDDENWINDDRYNKALALIIKPLKMTYFGDHINDKLDLNIPVYDKMAIFPMFKVLAKADNKLLYDRMNNEELGTIDMIAFESAIKVGGRLKFETYLDAENTMFNEADLNKPSYAKFNKVGNLPTYTQTLNLLRLQLNTDPHEHIERSFGTQAAKICLGNVIDDRTYGENKGESVKGSTIKSNTMEAINTLADKGRNNILRRFFKDKRINNKALSEYLISQAKSSGLSREMIEGLTLDANGEFKTPLAAMSTRSWVESRIISLVNKECVDINTPGGSAILMASFGFKATGSRKQSAIGAAFNNGNKLSFLNDDGSLDVMLSINFFRHVIPQEFQTNFGTMRKWLVDNDIIGSKAKPFGVGYRIPTLGLSSTFAFKVMDVLPSSVGDTIVVPDEFTGMTGSDFDVDKIYLATRNYTDGVIDTWNDEEIAGRQTVGALLNRLLDMYTLVISDKKNMAETKASIDTLTKTLLKKILPLVQPKLTEEAEPFYEMLPSFQLARKKEYTGGKMGIAPFALNSTNHCLTQFSHLTINYKKGNPYGLGALDEIRGSDGFRILDWLSAMINAHVDVAKDPYIMALNVNKVTYNMTSLLLRGGKGESTFYFMAQPILKQFADIKIANEGIYGVKQVYDNELIGDLYSAYEKRLYETIMLMDKSSSEYKLYAGKLNGWIKDRTPAANAKVQAKRQKPISDPNVEEIWLDRTLVFDDSSLIKSLKESPLKTAHHLYLLLLVLKAYNELSDDAQLLGELVLVSLIDTKKYGNNLIDQLDFNNKYNTFVENNAANFRLTDRQTTEDKQPLQAYFGETFLSKKLYLGTSLPRKILKYQTITATKLFSDLFSSTMAIFGEPITWTNRNGEEIQGYKRTGSRDKVRNIGKTLESIIRARITRNVDTFNLTDTLLVHMMYGRNTISKRLSGIKAYVVENKDQFPLLVNQDGTIRNELLNYLLEYSGDGINLVMDRIKLFNSAMNNSKNAENRLVSAFSDLLESEDEVVKEFANDLAMYAYITNYDNPGVNSFYLLVPLWWKLEHGYILNIKDALYDFSFNIDRGASNITEEQDVPAINYYPSVYITMARNMWRDEEVVKSYTPDYDKGDKNIFTTNLKIGKRITNVPLTFMSNRAKDAFIKINTTPDPEKALLYRKVATIGYINSESGEVALSRNIYQLVPKLGVKDGDVVYELLKESLELSAFRANAFDIDITPDFDLIKSKAFSVFKAPKTGEFTPFYETIQQLMIRTSLREDVNTDFADLNLQLQESSTTEVDGLVIDDPDSYFAEGELEASDDFFSLTTDFVTDLENATLDFGLDIVDNISAGESFINTLIETVEDMSMYIGEDVMTMENTELLSFGDLSNNETDFSDEAFRICKE